jgi:hypothetical protein
MFALAQSARRNLGEDAENNTESEPVMGLYLMDIVFAVFAIRGHIPQHDGFGAGGSESPLAASRLMRVVAAAIAAVAVLALVLWAAVWLAIKWL